MAPNDEEVVHHTRLGNDMLTEAVATEQTSPEICQVPKGKRVSRRGGSFTKEEDAIICSAFMNVSKDPIVGVNQSSGGYYKECTPTLRLTSQKDRTEASLPFRVVG